MLGIRRPGSSGSSCLFITRDKTSHAETVSKTSSNLTSATVCNHQRFFIFLRYVYLSHALKQPAKNEQFMQYLFIMLHILILILCRDSSDYNIY